MDICLCMRVYMYTFECAYIYADICVCLFMWTFVHVYIYGYVLCVHV